VPSPDLADDEQRWQIARLFAPFGITDMEQVRADARAILKLDHLADLRELTHDDADELIEELRRALGWCPRLRPGAGKGQP
jgi:hypothetical protein